MSELIHNKDIPGVIAQINDSIVANPVPGRIYQFPALPPPHLEVLFDLDSALDAAFVGVLTRLKGLSWIVERTRCDCAPRQFLVHPGAASCALTLFERGRWVAIGEHPDTWRRTAIGTAT